MGIRGSLAQRHISQKKGRRGQLVVATCDVTEEPVNPVDSSCQLGHTALFHVAAEQPSQCIVALFRQVPDAGCSLGR